MDFIVLILFSTQNRENKYDALIYVFKYCNYVIMFLWLLTLFLVCEGEEFVII
jgi:hypothetical protein